MLEPAASATRNGPIGDLRRSIAALPSSKIREVAHLGMGREDVIPLWFGESDLPTPKFICDAAAQALAAGDTFYQPNPGIAELRTALSDYMNRLYGTQLTLHNVIVSASGMNALMLVMQSLIDPGDVVVTTTPAWPNLPAVPRILTGAIREVPLSPGNAGWRLDLDRLFDACDARTRVIFLNSPNNPTGWMMSAEQQKAVLDFARKRGIWIVSDEVYARIVYDRPVAPSFLEQALPDDRVIVINSFSKTWSMTGWRLGWITVPAELGPTFEMLTEYTVAGPAGFIERAGVVAVRRRALRARDGRALPRRAQSHGRAHRANSAHEPADAGRRVLRLHAGGRHGGQRRVRQGTARSHRRRPRAGRCVRQPQRRFSAALLCRLAADAGTGARPARALHAAGLRGAVTARTSTRAAPSSLAPDDYQAILDLINIHLAIGDHDEAARARDAALAIVASWKGKEQREKEAKRLRDLLIPVAQPIAKRA